MASMKFGIGVVGVLVVAFANVATTWAQSDELPRRLRERISRTLVDEGFPSAAGAFDTEVKLTASDAAARGFGFSVAISDDTAIVGEFVHENGEFVSGAAYVYRRSHAGGDGWSEVTKITAGDGAARNWYAYSVAISGDTAIVGARLDNDNGLSSGAAYVYQKDKGGEDDWGEVTKITASDDGEFDQFGVSVAISGDTAIVGATFDGDNGSASGSAYVYQRNEGGVDNWGEVTKITASDVAAEDFFGGAVAISGDTAIVGASGDDDSGDFSGSAYVYQRNGGGADNWGEVAKITASDGAASDLFGGSLAISGDTAIVGGCFFCSAAYVYFEACLDDAACADGDACNGAETCNTESGQCLAGTSIECDDGDGCNGVESCDPPTGDCVDGVFGDCDGSGIDDACELADCGGEPGCDDCDGNGSLDRCDIAGGQPDVNGNGVLDTCEPPCTDNASCNDSDLCSFDRCSDNLCWHDEDARYGDVAGEGGVCGPDGDVNLSDIIAVLNAFADLYAGGCELVNVDIAGDEGSCVPNEIIDLSDILGVLNAFQGDDSCCGERS